MKIKKRLFELNLPHGRSAFLWGPCKVGKTYWITHALSGAENPEMPITFWRTSTGREVDFILGDKELAIGIRGSSRVHEGDIGALQALLEDGPVKKCFIVCLEKQSRRLTKNIESIPWQIFIERLWHGEFL